MHWENSEREIQQNTRHTSQLRTAIAVSLVLHGVILGMVLWLMDQRAQNRQPVIPDIVRINLLPFPEAPELQELPIEPAPAEEAERAAEVPNSANEIAEAPTPAPVELPLEQSLAPEPLVELPQLVEAPVAPSDSDGLAEPVRVPDTLTLRQAVRSVSEMQNRTTELSECTPAQRRNALFDCPDPGEPGYTAALLNPVYLSFNLPGPDEQSRRAMGTVADNQQQLRSGIQAFSPAGVDDEYLLEELSQGIEVYSATGNTRLERLYKQSLRNDPVYQQAERIMNPR